jgi:hypothetical protein
MRSAHESERFGRITAGHSSKASHTFPRIISPYQGLIKSRCVRSLAPFTAPESFAPDRSDQPFGKAILPRRGWCRGLARMPMARNRRVTMVP